MFNLLVEDIIKDTSIHSGTDSLSDPVGSASNSVSSSAQQTRPHIDLTASSGADVNGEGSTVANDETLGVVPKHSHLTFIRREGMDKPFADGTFNDVESPAGIMTVAGTPLAGEALKFALWDIGARAVLAAWDKISEAQKEQTTQLIKDFFHEAVETVNCLDKILKSWTDFNNQGRTRQQEEAFGTYQLDGEKAFRYDSFVNRVIAVYDFRHKGNEDSSFSRVWAKVSTDSAKKDFQQNIQVANGRYVDEIKKMREYIGKHLGLMTQAGLTVGQSDFEAAEKHHSDAGRKCNELKLHSSK